MTPFPAPWNGEPGVLGYYHGEVTSKNPSDPLIRKMVAIAKRLEANVQGDDGERYPESFANIQPPRLSLWRRLFGGG